MKIYPYSDDQRYRVYTRGDNVSSVIDKMIRVAAKTTECYASDIVLWCGMLNDTIKDHRTLACVLSFREDGVDMHEQEKLTSVSSGVLQQWSLTVTWDGNIPTTKFQRVRVST